MGQGGPYWKALGIIVLKGKKAVKTLGKDNRNNTALIEAIITVEMNCVVASKVEVNRNFFLQQGTISDAQFTEIRYAIQNNKQE